MYVSLVFCTEHSFCLLLREFHHSLGIFYTSATTILSKVPLASCMRSMCLGVFEDTFSLVEDLSNYLGNDEVGGKVFALFFS